LDYDKNTSGHKVFGSVGLSQLYKGHVSLTNRFLVSPYLHV